MNIAISAPTGFNSREILIPLRDLLLADSQINSVLVVTPAAKYSQEVFGEKYSEFKFVDFPGSAEESAQVLKSHQIDVVLTPTAGLDTNDVALLAGASKADIFSYTFVASWDNVYKMVRLRDRNMPYHLANRFGVWNEFMKNQLIENFSEIDSSQIDVVGVPRFDMFFQPEKILGRETVLAHLNFSDQSLPLLHCATTELYPFDYIIKSIAQASESKKIPVKTNLYASVHPGGDIAKHTHYKEWGAKVRYSFGRRDSSPLPEFQYFPTDKEQKLLVSLFKHTGVLVNQSSTTAIESMLADVPVINVAYGKALDWWRWRRSMVYRDFKQHYRHIIAGGGTTVVKNESELIDAVAQYLEDPTYKATERLSTTKKLVTYTDGKSSQRLLDLIKSSV